MKNFIKKLSTIALFAFIISSPIFASIPIDNFCTIGSTFDPKATQNITIDGAQGVLVQVCGKVNGCACGSWNQKTGGEMPLNPVPKNADGTYTLLSENGYTRYYLADASGKPIKGTVRLSNDFANYNNLANATWILNANGTNQMRYSIKKRNKK